MQVNLSGNGFGSAGAAILEGVLAEDTQITSLDISDNGWVGHSRCNCVFCSVNILVTTVGHSHCCSLFCSVNILVTMVDHDRCCLLSLCSINILMTTQSLLFVKSVFNSQSDNGWLQSVLFVMCSLAGSISIFDVTPICFTIYFNQCSVVVFNV